MEYPKFKNKYFIDHISFDRPLPHFDSDNLILQYQQNIAVEVAEKTDEEILKALIEIYRNTELNDLYVIDKEEFKRFLLKYIPVYMQECNAREE